MVNMAWTVILENEKREPVKSLNGEFYSSSLTTEKKQEDFTLLKYLNPYGDTVFNSLQSEDLIFDLNKLKEQDAQNLMIDDLIELAKHCKQTPHTYLIFYGD